MHRSAGFRHGPLHVGVFVASACLVSACFDVARPPRLDASPPHDALGPPFVLSIAALDARGQRRSLDAIPRMPTLQVRTSAPLSGDPEPVMLLRGRDDDALREDLAAAPLRGPTLARVVEVTRSTDDDGLRLQPTSVLEPGEELLVVVGAWGRDPSGRALGMSLVQRVRVDGQGSGGARAVDAWPPDGAAAVSPSLRFAALRFDGPVEGLARGVWLEDAEGHRLGGVAQPARCEALGWTRGACAVLVPDDDLRPATRHALRVGAPLVDATGAPVPAFAAHFTTAAETDTEAPRLTPTTCAVDEQSLEGLCVRAEDTRLVVRLSAGEAARVQARTGLVRTSAVAPRGEATLELAPLPPDTPCDVVLEATDAGGNTLRVSLAVRTTEPLATLSITEIRADPAGPEPRQEFVELENHGTAWVELEGFHLADAASSIGDPVVGPHRIAPGARLLLVPSDFDPDDTGPGGRDAPTPPGTTLVRMDRALGNAGLSNAGEPLFLRDPEGRRVSSAPATPAPREGWCTVRTSADPRTGAAAGFDYAPGGVCSPGR